MLFYVNPLLLCCLVRDNQLCAGEYGDPLLPGDPLAAGEPELETGCVNIRCCICTPTS